MAFLLTCVGSVDRRVESEESGDEEGKKHTSGIVADLSEQSLKDGVERGEEDPEGTRLLRASVPSRESSVPARASGMLCGPQKRPLSSSKILSGPRRCAFQA